MRLVRPWPHPFSKPVGSGAAGETLASPLFIPIIIFFARHCSVRDESQGYIGLVLQAYYPQNFRNSRGRVPHTPPKFSNCAKRTHHHQLWPHHSKIASPTPLPMKPCKSNCLSHRHHGTKDTERACSAGRHHTSPHLCPQRSFSIIM